MRSVKGSSHLKQCIYLFRYNNSSQFLIAFEHESDEHYLNHFEECNPCVVAIPLLKELNMEDLYYRQILNQQFAISSYFNNCNAHNLLILLITVKMISKTVSYVSYSVTAWIRYPVEVLIRAWKYLLYV